MTYLVELIHPKAAALLYDLAELGLISIVEEENNVNKPDPSFQQIASKPTPTGKNGAEKSEVSREGKLNLDDLPPIVKSMLGTFESTEDFDYKEELTKALAEKYL